MSKVLHYKTLEASKVDVTVPEKIKNKYFSYLSYEGNPIYVQTPTLKFAGFSDDKSHVQFTLRNDHLLVEKMEELRNHCIDVIHQNTVKFFRGRNFSRNKIESSLNWFTEKNEDHTVFDLPVIPNIVVKNQRNVDVDVEDIQAGTETVSIINIEGVVFSKTDMSIKVSVHQMKVYIEEKLSGWSIINDSDDEMEEEIDADVAEAQAKALDEAELVNLDINEHLSSLHLQEKIEGEQVENNNDDEKNLFG